MINHVFPFYRSRRFLSRLRGKNAGDLTRDIILRMARASTSRASETLISYI